MADEDAVFMRSAAPGSRVPRRTLAGYTLIELITTLAILAVLAGIAAPRFFDYSTFDARGYADQLAAALRQARAVAVGSGCRVRVEILPAGYSAAQPPPAGGHCDLSSTSYPTPVRSPDGSLLAGSAPSGIMVTPTVTVIFDAEGRAVSGGGVDITIGTHTLRVESASGLVRGP